MQVLVAPGGVIIEQPSDPRVVQVVAAGVPGPPGRGVEPVAAVALEAVAQGMPMAIDRATGKLVNATAAYKPKAFVVGLASAAVAPGFVGAAEVASLTLADWTGVTGAAALQPGGIYFLGATGGLSLTPPPAPACVAIVGEAISPTTLRLTVHPPIQP
ncbi:MAG: hypothetical protein JO290_01355 [Sphingomonadaceae bacterium]|nr:hypothetical protein [Sphingomonadaceae bacterium]